MRFIILAIIFITASCTMEPKYQKPKPSVPLAEKSSEKDITRITWQEYFKSSDLQRVIQLALDNNRDLHIANLNIEAAKAAYNISKANFLPSINATGYETRQGVPGAFAAFMPKRQYRANLSLMSFELDFFGRLRSLKKSALEDFLSTEQAKETTRISLIAETANAYAQVLLDQKLFTLAQENFSAQSKKAELVKMRYESGVDSRTTFLATTIDLETAKMLVESRKKMLEQSKSTLMILTGIFDEKSLPIDGSMLDGLQFSEELLDFIPSSQLLARPDIKKAEHDLLSANANIGAARAAFFPVISLSGFFGYGSRDLSKLFSSNSDIWSITPQVTLPIFNGGRNITNLKLSHTQKKIRIAQYEKTIQTAFKEAKDELANRESAVQDMKSSNTMLESQQEAYAISLNQNKQGSISSLDLADARMLLIKVEELQANNRKNYITNLISLYKVLGGGSESK